ncbi:hypothetical protein [Enterovibrio norvegicus]|uniref:hypothetical protein n=1 Tax=Enterovibrio norvegicus TaxID=188144 RepID=UPI00352FC160
MWKKPTLILPALFQDKGGYGKCWKYSQCGEFVEIGAVINRIGRESMDEAFNLLFLCAESGLISAKPIQDSYGRQVLSTDIERWVSEPALSKAKTHVRHINTKHPIYAFLPGAYMDGLIAILSVASKKKVSVSQLNKIQTRDVIRDVVEAYENAVSVQHYDDFYFLRQGHHMCRVRYHLGDTIHPTSYRGNKLTEEPVVIKRILNGSGGTRFFTECDQEFNDWHISNGFTKAQREQLNASCVVYHDNATPCIALRELTSNITELRKYNE